ncbi:MAG: hypothetical protein K2X64_10195, partial [Rhodocyclaceae bacterium]|nr:hypothetical protein [Rhodocyclaceae bacterium]
MRNYVLEYLNVKSAAQRQAHYDAWARVPTLVTATEVANLSKRFKLRVRRSGQPATSKTRSLP